MIYQFIPNAPVRVVERLIRSMVPGTMAILDLKNGYLDVRDLERCYVGYWNILKFLRMSSCASWGWWGEEIGGLAGKEFEEERGY